MMKLKLFLYTLLFVFTVHSCGKQSEAISRRQNFDAGWKFHHGDVSAASAIATDDSRWKSLDLPHDWSVEFPFTKEKDRIATGQTVGGTAWYRKKFVLQPAQEGKILQLYFEGAYMETEVWLNGRKVAEHPYGYTSFFCDIMPYCNPAGEENVVAVKVSNEGKNSRWYSGSGIYRHVWLVTVDRLHLDTWGVFVTTPSVTEDKAVIRVAADVINETDKTESAELFIQLKDRSNKVVNEQAVQLTELKAGEKFAVVQDFELTKPVLWSADSPVLYTAAVSIKTENQIRDETVTSFGIRSISFEAGKGFLLNGKPLELKGGCVHHDNGLLGAASIDRAEWKKAELLKANGFNAVRCAHNPPAEKFLEACDQLGLLVIDEAFDQWQKMKNPEDYHRFFDDRHEKDLASMVCRDRNHPSVILWSIGNEIQERADSSGVAIAKKLKAIIRQYDTTRPITAAINEFWDNPSLKWKDSERAFSLLDVCGYNYMWREYENDLDLFPDRIIHGSESTAMERVVNWDLVEKHPSVIGDFVWTAIDYLGESGIGHALEVKNGDPEPPMFLDWPWFNAWCGDIDICGNKKPQSLLRDVLWNESKIAMAVRKPLPEGYHAKISYWGWPEEYPEWNWKGNENKPLQVNVYTRYPVVRLYLNGQLRDEKPVSKYTATFSVNYSPGELKAVGVESGKETKSVLLRTTGAPATIRLTPDRLQLANSRNDLSYIRIELTDEEGQTVPDADCRIRLSVSGPGEIAASGNASATDMESFRSLTPKTFRGKALAIIRPTGQLGKIRFNVTAEGLPETSVEINTQ